jgi:hypothetical protein
MRLHRGTRPTAAGFLGFAESILVYCAVALGEGTIAAAYLALKVASKWQSWAILEQKDPKTATPGDVVVRHRTFVFGTAANVVAGLLGALVTRALIPT